MSGPPGLMVDVEAGVLVEALVLGDVVAGELRLRDPFELQRHLVGGLRRGRGQRRAAHGAASHQSVSSSFHPVSSVASDVVRSSSSFRAIGRMPEGHAALDERDERRRTAEPASAATAIVRPDHVDVHAADLGRDAKAHADDRRAEELGDDGADQGQRRVDLERVEDERQRRRQAQLEQRLPVARRRRCASGRAPSRPAAARPATVFTSIGKKVMMTTTAALDCQSKPNHITMIGATPTIGSAETRLPSGSSPRCRKGTRSARMATTKPAPQPMT